MINKDYIGSSLDDLLAEDGTLAEVEAAALKRVLAWQITQNSSERNMPAGLPQIRIEPKTGSEPFISKGRVLDWNLSHFWQWSSSNLIDNALRGVLAEFIVAKALNCLDGPRMEWASWDLETSEGIRVEVKAAGYVQSWKQDGPSNIRFRIGPRRAWNPENNVMEKEQKRNAHVYVFCVLKTKDQDKINPMDLDQWDFYIVPASRLDRLAPGQKTIGLEALKKKLEPVKCGFEELERGVFNAGLVLNLK